MIKFLCLVVLSKSVVISGNLKYRAETKTEVRQIFVVPSIHYTFFVI